MESLRIGILFLLGITVVGGMIGAWVFQKIRIPQVVGYIVIGLIFGRSGLGIVSETDIDSLYPFNLFALGVIGFLVGGELKIDMFRKYFKQFFTILVGEGLGATFLVSTATFLIMYFVTNNVPVSIAAAAIFGAISSATDPASTIDVLWEYRCKGILTTTITAIVALDDALAMLLYGLGVSVAMLLVNGQNSFGMELLKVTAQLFGACAMGFTFALILTSLLKWILGNVEKNLAACLGLILLLISMSVYWNVDVILAAMTFGFCVANISPKRSEDLFNLLRGFSIPIYVMFFVLVGAGLSIGKMPLWLWFIVIAYVLGRSIGKVVGAYFGANISRAPLSVKRYLGLGLFAQGGVAVGLSLMATQRLGAIRVADNLLLSDAIIFSITATTLIIQLIGPYLVKLSVKFAGEIGRNVTEEDIINSLTVQDVMDKDIEPVPECATVKELVKTFASADYAIFPVVNFDKNIIGTVSLENIKDVLDNQESWAWLLASDIMEPYENCTSPSSPLCDILRRMQDLKIDQLPVVMEEDKAKPAGILDFAKAHQRIKQEMIRRQEEASEAVGLAV